MADVARILVLADIVGRSGRKSVQEALPKMIARLGPFDLVVGNAENLADGKGVTAKTLKEMEQSGIQVFTGGNHTFDNKEIYDLFPTYPHLIRPANYPSSVYYPCPGKGYFIFTTKTGLKILVLNLIGRVFMENYDCPFIAADRLINDLRGQYDIAILDMHAESSSEKIALASFLDGRISAFWGSHTHVPTADSRVLAKGCGFLTDVGMSGSYDSIIGVETPIALQRFFTKRPIRFEFVKTDGFVHACLFEINLKSRHCTLVKRIKVEPFGKHPFLWTEGSEI